MSITKIKDKDTIPIARDGNDIIYFSPKKDMEKQGRSYESVNDMEIIPYLNLKSHGRSANFISGVSGSGKSTVARQMIDELLKIAKPKPQMVILITKTKELDPVFKDFKKESDKLFIETKMRNFMHLAMSIPQHLSLVLSLAENMEDAFKDTLVVLDDWQNLGDKRIEKLVLNFINDLLERSRKLRCNVIIISHVTQQQHTTKTILFESDNIVLFPGANKNSVKKYLYSYADLSHEEAQTIVDKADEPHDFLLYRKSYPILYQTKRTITLA
jgi:RecA-family ATPase